MRHTPDFYKEKIVKMLALPVKHYYSPDNTYTTEILSSTVKERADYLLALLPNIDGHIVKTPEQRFLLLWLQDEIFKKPLPVGEEDFVALLETRAVRQAAHLAHLRLQGELSSSGRQRLCELRQRLSTNYSPNYDNSFWTPVHMMRKIAQALGGIEEGIGERGEAWIEAAITDINALSTDKRAVWLQLFAHARTAKEGKPKNKWLEETNYLLEQVERTEFERQLQAWFPLFGKDDDWEFADREINNDAAFKGLVWMASLVKDPAIVDPLGAALRGSLKARGRANVRSQKVCNALLWTLSGRDEVEAVSALANAKRIVKHGAILKTIEKSLSEIATRLGVAPDDLQELATPDFGLEHGKLKRDFDGVSLEINFATGKASWNWTSAEGKPLKNPPTNVKAAFSTDLKDLKTQTSEIEKVIATVKNRLDLAVRDEKTWLVAAWRERYFDHPLTSLVATHLIWEWQAVEGSQWSAFLPQLDSPTIPNDAHIRLWHPIFQSVEEVLHWRQRLENAGVQQPWKQAHREVYLLTHAERTTGTYSNRFAAHILKQHQFNALCGARGWKNSLRLMVDDHYPPATKTWPRYNMRAEFWIEGAGDNYGEDTNDTGTYWRLATDQVRFYPLEASENRAHAGSGEYRTSLYYRETPTSGLRLEDAPPLVFSETMRDIDLFVGVASIGNDPAWEDGGPTGFFREYWRRYGFGEPEESAKSRADVLSRLIPRLKIRDRARIEGRFLHVEGRLRSYKIHLGSGNILMEPNDQYLCIVPKGNANSEVLLPFEGDRTLAVIVSKALLLADDDKIKDSSILSQIQRK